MKKFIAVGVVLSSLLFFGVGSAATTPGKLVLNYACQRGAHEVRGICYDQEDTCAANCKGKGGGFSCKPIDHRMCNDVANN